jgi:hypothetical protein
MKITTEKIICYYVEEDGFIYGGPFATREEAGECLKSYRKRPTLPPQVSRASNDVHAWKALK